MSLSQRLGCRGSLLAESPAAARLLEIESPILTEADLAAIQQVHDVASAPLSPSRADHEARIQARRENERFDAIRPATIDCTWPITEGESRAAPRRAPRLCAGGRGGPGRPHAADPQRPGRERRARADPVAAGGERGAQSPDRGGRADARQPDRRERRAARGASLRRAAGLRRQRDPPVAGPGVHRRRPGRGRPPHRGHLAGRGAAQLRQGGREGRPQDHVQDGHRHARLLLRRAGVRRGGHQRRADPGRVRRHGELQAGRHHLRQPGRGRAGVAPQRLSQGERTRSGAEARQLRLLQGAARRRAARLLPGSGARAARGGGAGKAWSGERRPESVERGAWSGRNDRYTLHALTLHCPPPTAPTPTWSKSARRSSCAICWTLPSTTGSLCRWTRSSRSRRSCAGSPARRCRTAR